MIIFSRLFDQATLLAGQVYNPVGYQRRLNILLTLIDNSTKDKGMLKEDSLKLDDVENEYIFEDRFE